MSFDINTVTLLGRLTKDPELKQTNSGKNVCTFSIANNTSNDDSNVSYYDIRTWEKSAQNCAQYLKKGSQVAVSGRLKQDRWQSEDGKKNYRIIIEGTNIQFVGSKSANTTDGNLQPNQSENEPTVQATLPNTKLPDTGDLEDIPF